MKQGEEGGGEKNEKKTLYPHILLEKGSTLLAPIYTRLPPTFAFMNSPFIPYHLFPRLPTSPALSHPAIPVGNYCVHFKKNSNLLSLNYRKLSFGEMGGWNKKEFHKYSTIHALAQSSIREHSTIVLLMCMLSYTPTHPPSM